ncbi:type 1 periplasmic-binding domain-containing protein [Marinomonas epiphytica]
MRLHIARLALFCLIWMSSISSAANFQSGFIEIDDYFSASPEQKLLTEQLESIVSRPPVPLARRMEKAIRIVIVLSGPETSERNRSLLAIFKRRMRELRIDYRLDVYSESTTPSSASIIGSYDRITEIQPDYLVITDTGPLQFRFVERFLRRGKPKVIYYNLSMPLKNWQHHSPLMYLGFDETKVAHRLARILHDRLSSEAEMDAFVLPPSYLGHRRCNAFLDQMVGLGHHFRYIIEVEDDAQHTYLKAKQVITTPSEFIFSCTQNISNGIQMALQELPFKVKSKTNHWSESAKQNTDGFVVSGIYWRDELTIALVEGIKLDLLGRRVPKLMIGKVTFWVGADRTSLVLQTQRDANKDTGPVWKQ